MRADEMRDAVMVVVKKTDIFISVAAVADYAPTFAKPQKIKKSESSLILELRPTPDILAEVAALKRPPFCIGFAAETENLEKYAQAKRKKKHLPLVVGNLVHDTMGKDEALLVLFDDQGTHPLPKADKLTCARRLIKEISLRLRPTKN
jgi:phosphopantothenoylcysteine decarboxylase/phosphopantothenate--cysteine ligase